MNRAADDSDARARLAAFLQGLQQLGWIDGRNVRIDTRWGEDKIDLEQKYAAELLALAPDIVLASGAPSVTALQHISGKLPIVFVGIVDPVGAGFAILWPGRVGTLPAL
jgi:putative tryptophan/tyrosine transport system substrate-binding protein